jgi:uncharacterized protein (TIGR02391 family)
VGRRILDPSLMAKLASKLGRPEKSIGVTVSKTAHKLGVSSEAALILLAKQHGTGTAVYQRKLDAAKQAEVRDALPGMFATGNRKEAAAPKPRPGDRQAPLSKRASLKLAIEYLIQDPVLLGRCQDLLLAPSNFDRAINQATQVLEDRIRTTAQPPKKLTGENLVNYAFNEALAKTVLQVASKDPDDQRGFTQLLRGIVPAFRNKTHHHIADTFSREESMRVCGFIDVLLRVVDSSTKVR